MYVGPDVETRGVVLAQINRVGQYLVAAFGPDQQVRGIFGGIVCILSPLVGDRGYRSLHVGQQIRGSRSRAPRKMGFGTVHIIVGIIRRCSLDIKDRHRARHGEQLHGKQLDIRGLNRNIVGYFRHGTLYLDRGQRTARSRDRNVAVPRHRQSVVCVFMRNGKIFRYRTFAQITVQIGGDAHSVVARQTFETQCRRGLVTV